MATVEWTDERLNDAFERLMAEMAAMRADLKDMRAELKGDLVELRVDLKGDIAGLKADFGDVRADIRMLWTSLIGGLVALVVAFAGAAAAIATQL